LKIEAKDSLETISLLNPQMRFLTEDKTVRVHIRFKTDNASKKRSSKHEVVTLALEGRHVPCMRADALLAP
jgi:hypothetical protein